MTEEASSKNERKWPKMIVEGLIGLVTLYAAFVREPKAAAEAGYNVTSSAIIELSQQIQTQHTQLELMQAHLLVVETSCAATEDPDQSPLPTASSPLPVSPPPPLKLRSAVPLAGSTTKTSVFVLPASSGVAVFVAPSSSVPPPPSPVHLPSFDTALAQQK